MKTDKITSKIGIFHVPAELKHNNFTTNKMQLDFASEWHRWTQKVTYLT